MPVNKDNKKPSQDPPAGGNPPGPGGNGGGNPPGPGGNGGGNPPGPGGKERPSGPTTAKDDDPKDKGQGPGGNGHGSRPPGVGHGDEGGRNGASTVTPPTAPVRPDDGPGPRPPVSEPSPEYIPRIEAVSAALSVVTFPIVLQTRYGNIRATDIKILDNGVGTVPWVDVTIDGPGETHFRIFNPPTLVEDPSGDVTAADGRRYRLDPIVAIVESVAMHGGKPGKR